MEMDIEQGLRTLGVEGHIRFSIKADNTKENQRVHDAFKEFCKLETDNNYTQGLRKLLEYIERDWKMETIWNKIEDINSRLATLEQKKKEVKTEKKEVF